MCFPQAHRAKLHSTNPIERLNGDIKRRTDLGGIFPNEAAIAPPTISQVFSGKCWCNVIPWSPGMARVFGSAC